MSDKRVFLIGYGNSSRGDDGLGPAFIDVMESKQIPGVTCDANFQLTVEDALTICDYQQVVFVDAIENEPRQVAECGGFGFYPVDELEPIHVTTHSVSPGAVVRLAKTLFHAETQAYILAIRGYCFDQFTEQLSVQAKENMEQALQFLTHWLNANNDKEPGT